MTVATYTEVNSLYEFIEHDFITDRDAIRFIDWTKNNGLYDDVFDWLENGYGSLITTNIDDENGLDVYCVEADLGENYEDILYDLKVDKALRDDCIAYMENKNVSERLSPRYRRNTSHSKSGAYEGYRKHYTRKPIRR